MSKNLKRDTYASTIYNTIYSDSNLLHAEDKKEKNRNKVIEVKPETQKGEITSTNEDLGITVNKLQSETQGITKSKPKTYIDTIGSTPILINGDFRYRLESEQAIIDDQENNDVLRLESDFALSTVSL